MRAILTYHSIDSSESVISVAPDTFRRQMQWLAGSGIDVLSIGNIVQATKPAIAITFDDAYSNFSEHALPVLREHRLPATLFVVTGRTGRTNDWNDISGVSGIPRLDLLDWDGLRITASAGVDIGSHGREHLDLSKASADELTDDVAGSAEDLTREIGVPPTAFAFPFGRSSAAATAVVAREYRYSCTTELRALLPSDGAHDLPRLDMYYFREKGRLETFGTPAFTRYLMMRRIGRGVRHSIFGD